ncbi:MAG: ABC transporter permease [Candidatus Thorarchaeota archaeon]
MNLSFRVVRASLLKEMRVWKRSPHKLALVILLPLMFFSGFSMLMGGVYFGSGVETAVVIQEQNPGFYTEALIEILGEYDPIPPRLDPIMMDSETANALFQNGEILLVITIPEGFEDAIANNDTTSIQVQVANIHEDLTKNLRMPVIRKIDLFYQRYLLNDSLVDFEVESLRPFTPPRLAYMAWTIAIYSVMFGGIFAAGSAMTQEFEQDTMDELILSNQSPIAIYAGKMLSGVIIAHVALPFLFLLSFALFGVWPNGDILVFLAMTLPLAIFSSGLGLIAGAIFRNSVFVVPVAALGGIFYWITGGGIAPLELVGETFGMFDEYLPVSNVYRSMIRMFVEGSYGTLIIDTAVIVTFAIIFLLISPLIANRLSGVDIGTKLEKIKQRRAKGTQQQLQST